MSDRMLINYVIIENLPDFLLEGHFLICHYFKTRHYYNKKRKQLFPFLTSDK